jgi:hypothetical protein
VPALRERYTAELVEPHTSGADAFLLEEQASLPSDEAYPCPCQDGLASYVAAASCRADRRPVREDNQPVGQTLVEVASFPAESLHLEASCPEGETGAACIDRSWSD